VRRRDFPRHSLQPVLAPCHQNEAVTVLRKQVGQFLAYAGGRTGYDRPAGVCHVSTCLLLETGLSQTVAPV
jgi:hypothetical protein